jgi:nucleoside-diphosphate-sugar epimerase
MPDRAQPQHRSLIVPRRLVIIGLGYTGQAVAAAALAAGWQVCATTRQPRQAPAGVELVPFAAAGALLASASHVLVTAPPDEAGDPVLAAFGPPPALRWLGYISTTGVYGDRDGATVHESDPPSPMQDRTRRRVAAEAAWGALASRCAVDLMRAGGIYGPGRSALDDLAEGTARRVLKPGHAFSRIHVADIAQAVLAAIATAGTQGLRVLHLVDDEPAESACVVAEAARLLGVAPPAPVPFAEAFATMSPMARSFWAENKRVANAATKRALGIAWRYPSYREGLRAIHQSSHGGA